MGFFSSFREGFKEGLNDIPAKTPKPSPINRNNKSTNRNSSIKSEIDENDPTTKIMLKVTNVLESLHESLNNLKEHNEDWFGIIPKAPLSCHDEDMQMAENSRKALIQTGIWNAFAELPSEEIYHVEKSHMEAWNKWMIWITDDLRKKWLNINSGGAISPVALELITIRSNCIVAELKQLYIRRDVAAGPLPYIDINTVVNDLILAMGGACWDNVKEIKFRA